jgi:hypothetical protein
MKRTLGLLAACAALAMAPAAMATTYSITVTGTIDSLAFGPGSPDIHVGDTLTLTTVFTDADHVITWGSNGYKVFSAQGLPTSGTSFWRIDGLGQTWTTAENDIRTFNAFYWPTAPGPPTGWVGPGLTFTDTQLLGVGEANLFLTNTLTHNTLVFNNPWPLYTTDGSFPALPLTSTFRIQQPYASPNPYTYNGHFDLSSATILVDGVNLAALPEPSTWAEMIVGLGLVGFALRRRRAIAAA